MRTLKHFLDRPSEHLQKYPVLLEAIFNETAEGNPDGEFLMEAIGAIKNLRRVAQLQTFQSSMGKPQGAWHWHKLVSPEVMESMTKSEKRRQALVPSLNGICLLLSSLQIYLRTNRDRDGLCQGP